MAVRLRASVDGMRSAIALHRKIETRSKNFRSVFRWARRELEEANIENFRTNGLNAGDPWPPLDADYAGWKLANYGANGILIREGDLYRSLRFLRGSPNSIGPNSATFGTDLPYAKFHQTGTSQMPQRKIVFAPDLFAERLGRVILNYLVDGTDPTKLPVGTLRRTFTR